MTDVIQMRFPADTEYISAIRLAVSGVAGKLEFGIDEIEDLKSCVSEACLLLLCGQKCSGIGIDMELEDSIKLNVKGLDVEGCDDCLDEHLDFNEEISRLMIQALSENVDFQEENGLLQSISFQKEHNTDTGE